MGCIIGGNTKGNHLILNNDLINTNSNQTLENNSIFVHPHSSFSNRKLKSLFSNANTPTNNLFNSKTICSTSLFNTNESLILKFSKEFNKEYEIISINQNTLKNKNNNIKIVKECPSHAIFSFGGEVIDKNNNLSNSSSFRSSHFNENEEVDVILEENNIQPHQFDIEYFVGKYYIKGYNEGTGIFLKIDEKILIEPEEKYIFLFNQKSFLNILINEDKNLVYFDYNGESKGEFNYKENNIIFIGRSQKCNLVLNDEDGVSRIQFTLLYDKNNNEFYLYDGFYCEEKKKTKISTNGIWLLLNNNNKILIKNEMVFKTGKTLILCQYKEV